MFEKPTFFNEDSVKGCQKHIPDGTVDLIITDPPYGIDGDLLHRHYNRKEEFVHDGYVEVPASEYPAFSVAWIKESERILRPGGSIYIVSGYTNLIHILNALRETGLREVNHLIWKYNFGVHTKRKYVSSHYHILYYVKPGGDVVFNTYSRFGAKEKGDQGGSMNYMDREDVWIINREYKPGKRKNKNELPSALLMKILQYSSNEGDLVCDLFLGGFSTATYALGLGRRCVGFEVSETAYNYGVQETELIEPGKLLSTLRNPDPGLPPRQGQPFESDEKERIAARYHVLLRNGNTKKKTIDILSREFGRGYWSLEKVLKSLTSEKDVLSVQSDMFGGMGIAGFQNV